MTTCALTPTPELLSILMDGLNLGIRFFAEFTKQAASQKLVEKTASQSEENLASRKQEKNVGLVGLEEKTDLDQQEQPAEGGSFAPTPTDFAEDSPNNVARLARKSLAMGKVLCEAQTLEQDDLDQPDLADVLPLTNRPALKRHHRVHRPKFEVRLPQHMIFKGPTNEHAAHQAVKSVCREASIDYQDNFRQWCNEHRIDQGELDYAVVETRRQQRSSPANRPIHSPVSYIKKIVLDQRNARTQHFGTLWPARWRGMGFVFQEEKCRNSMAA